MIPRSLRVIALIQLLCGVLTVAGIAVQLTRGHINLDAGVLGIPIYFGLMRLSRGWRTCALVFIWGGILLASVGFIMGVATHAPAYLQIFGIPLAPLTPIRVSALSLAWLFLQVWQYRILTRDDIRSLFVSDAADDALDVAVVRTLGNPDADT